MWLSPGRVKPGVLESLGGGCMCVSAHACVLGAPHMGMTVMPSTSGAIHRVSHVSDSLRLRSNCSHENANPTSSAYGPSPPGSVHSISGGIWGPREAILHVFLTHALQVKLV